MILDAELLFSNNQALTKTGASSKILNMEDCVGAGYGLTPFVQVAEEFVGLTSLSVQVQMADSADADADAWETIIVLPSKTLAELNKEKLFYLAPLPAAAGKFLRLNYVVVGTPTKGKLTAGLILVRQDG